MGVDLTAETWGTALSSGDGETFVSGFGGVRGIIELTQLQAEKRGVLSCILCLDSIVVPWKKVD
jgi:hypothetical protein